MKNKESDPLFEPSKFFPLSFHPGDRHKVELIDDEGDVVESIEWTEEDVQK